MSGCGVSHSPTWGYTRLVGALGNLGHQIGRNTIKRVLRRHGLEPAPARGKRMPWKTFLRTHLGAIARKYDGSARRGTGRPATREDVQQLVVRMATENPTWGYTRLVGALSNLGYRVGRNTVKRVLRRHGLEPAPARGKRMPLMYDYDNYEPMLKKKFKHDLEKLVREGEHIGIIDVPSPDTAKEINGLNQFYMNHRLRYADVVDLVINPLSIPHGNIDVWLIGPSGWLKKAAARKDVLTVLRARGIAVPDAAEQQILTERDLARLKRWLERASVASSIAEVIDDAS